MTSTIGITRFLLLIASVHSYSSYRNKIPNGNNIPHPCFGSDTWDGVGHQRSEGGGELNPFGQDFKDNGFVWDKCLCETDSDGDGFTNGAELGDPNCLFTEGGVPEIIIGITHPGVCEPVDSAKCVDRNNFDVCLAVEFQCNSINEPNVDVYDLLFPETTLPEDETIYYCMAVTFNDTFDAHAFAMEPVVNNRELVHHIDLTECTSNADDILRDFAVPGPCSDMPSCDGINLAGWSLGQSGICLPENTGIMVGQSGVTVANLRIHYHNPMHRSGETDKSGLRMYATKNIRQYEASVFSVQQMYLEIPPGQQKHEESAVLIDKCTETFNESINLIMGFFHMHYLGIGAYAELWRNEEFVQEIYRDNYYRFDAPTFKQFDEPIVMHPGDEIRSTCVYQSMDRSDITWRGQASTDEMCGHHFVYYPQQSFRMSQNRGALPVCSYRGLGTEKHWDEVCDYNDFKVIYNGYMKNMLSEVCDTTGGECYPDCKNMLEWAFNNHTCLVNDTRSAIFKAHGEFAKMQSSCKDYPDPAVQVSSESPEAARPESCIAKENDGNVGDGSSGNSGSAAIPKWWFTTLFLIMMRAMMVEEK